MTSAHNDARVLICGVSRAGKSTLANIIAGGGRLLSADSLLNKPWSEQSEIVAQWMDEPGPWVIEGTTVARAVRKWLRTHPVGTPCDQFIWLDTPREHLSPGRLSLAKGTRTIMLEVAPVLAERGVTIDHPDVAEIRP